MDRRDFLWVTASAGTGVALAGTTSIFSASDTVRDVQKGGGRALVAEPVLARVSSGSFPFALARFAEDASFIAAPKRLVDAANPALLSPIRDVSFHGFSGGAGVFADDDMRVVAVHRSVDGVTVRHDLWSHAPKRRGGTSQSVLFTAHDDAFVGFEITHMPLSGGTTSGSFGFAASGSGPLLKPGVYVLAGPSAATGVAPDLGRYAYSGNKHLPVRASRALGLDFAYLSFVVYGEWI